MRSRPDFKSALWKQYHCRMFWIYWWANQLIWNELEDFLEVSVMSSAATSSTFLIISTGWFHARFFFVNSFAIDMKYWFQLQFSWIAVIFFSFPHANSFIKTLRLRQNGRHFTDDIFKCIFLDENIWISINISLKLIFKGPVHNIIALVQIMAWHWPSDKPLSEPMMVSLLTHICVTRPQWVKTLRQLDAV